MQEVRLGNIYGATGGNHAGWVYDINGAAPTLNTCEGGGRQPMIFDICAMRGRDKENPSNRDRFDNLEQRLEPNADGLCNAITTVQKDNLVLVRQATKDGMIPCEVGGGNRFELPNKQNKTGPCNRKREHSTDTDNGEYPQCA